MALKVTLKPNERMIIGGAVITNCNTRSDLVIENQVPILRQKDIMGEEEANSPCRRIYFIIQLMYIDGRNLAAHHSTYWELVRGLLEAAPSMLPLIEQAGERILAGKYYQALKIAKKMIQYEQEVLNREQKSSAGV